MARRRRGLLAGLRPEPSTLKMDPTIPADLVARADLRAHPADRTDPVTREDLRAHPADRTDPVTREDPQAHPADRTDPVTRADPQAHPADLDHGMGIRSVVTSTGPRGEKDPHLGDQVHHRGLTGAGRSHRPGGNG